MKADPGNITYGAQIHMIYLSCQDRYISCCNNHHVVNFKNVPVIIEAQLRIMIDRQVIYVCGLF